MNDFLRKATRKKVGDKMKACSESASDDELEATISACGQMKALIKDTLAKDSITNIDVKSFVRDGARESAKDAMSLCADRALALSDANAKKTALDNCKTGAKSSIAEALGKRAADVDGADLEKELKNIAASAAASAALRQELRTRMMMISNLRSAIA